MPNLLTEKLGPLPAWAWGGIVGGGILVFRLVTKRESNDPAEMPEESYEVPTQTSRSPTSYMPFSAPPDSVSLDEAREEAISGAVDILDPRLVNLETLVAEYDDSLQDARGEINTQAQQLAAWQIALGEWVKAIGTVNDSYAWFAANTNDRFAEVNAALATPREVNNDPHALPPPASPAKPIPHTGDHVWQGTSPPNMTTINNLLLNKYGKVVPTRTTRPGGGGYLVVIA